MERGAIIRKVRRVGLDNKVTLPAADVQRLLETSEIYDFLADFVREVAGFKFTVEDRVRLRQEQRDLIRKVRDREIRGHLAPEIDSAMGTLAGVVDKAERLASLYPPASWHQKEEAHG